MDRIVLILDPPYMFGETQLLGHARIPQDMNLRDEQVKWMDLGPDSNYRNFYDYLIDQPGVVPFDVEQYFCEYQ